MDKNLFINEIGRMIFQHKYISLSYRYRGKVARVQIKKNINSKKVIKKILEFNDVPKKRIDDKALKNRIIIYSAIKIIANLPLLYSVLNPETSSLSPSAKSNGVRFNSAIIEISHNNNGI